MASATGTHLSGGKDGISPRALPSSCSVSISERGGFGCDASSSNFADRRSVRAFSTGPKTLALSLELLVFLTLDLAPLAMLMCLWGGGIVRREGGRRKVQRKVHSCIDKIRLPAGEHRLQTESPTTVLVHSTGTMPYLPVCLSALLSDCSQRCRNSCVQESRLRLQS